jgi:hypothetical protein
VFELGVGGRHRAAAVGAGALFVGRRIIEAAADAAWRSRAVWGAGRDW